MTLLNLRKMSSFIKWRVKLTKIGCSIKIKFQQKLSKICSHNENICVIISFELLKNAALPNYHFVVNWIFFSFKMNQFTIGHKPYQIVMLSVPSTWNQNISLQSLFCLVFWSNLVSRLLEFERIIIHNSVDVSED